MFLALVTRTGHSLPMHTTVSRKAAARHEQAGSPLPPASSTCLCMPVRRGSARLFLRPPGSRALPLPTAPSRVELSISDWRSAALRSR